MQPQKVVNVSGPGGLRGTLDTATWPLDGSKPHVLVRLEDGRELMVAWDALTPHENGTYRLDLRPEELDLLSREARAGGAARVQAAEDAERIIIPVVAEQLAVGTRTVETGRVRITKMVREEQQVVDQPLLQEQVMVERVPVNQFIDAATPTAARQEGDVLIIPVVEEVLVVEKRLMLKEEVRVSKRRAEVREPQTVTVRIEDVKIERVPVEGGPAGGGPES